MLEPILVEDITFTKLVPSLERILKDLNKNSIHHDYIVALIIVLLAEAGFYPLSRDSDRSQCSNLRSLHIPKNWKIESTGMYNIYFQLETVPHIKCKLFVLPLGDELIVSFYPLLEEGVARKGYSMMVQTLRHVNPYSTDISGRYFNLKVLSHSFKNTISTPARSDILIKAGVMGPSLQALPIELKYRILRLLDARTLTKMAQCCKQFCELCSDSQLWKSLIQRDFPNFIRTSNKKMTKDKDYCYQDYILARRYSSFASKHRNFENTDLEDIFF